MTSDKSIQTTVVTVLAVLLAIPLLMMGVVMPVVGLAGLGPMSVGHTAWGTILMPALPIVVLLGLGYLLYAGVVDGSGREPDSALAQLRSAYARGDLSEEEFEERRDRLR